MSVDSDDSVEVDSSLESMPTHRAEWKQHELLSTILSRYFYVASNMSGGVLPTWVVSPKNDKEIDDCLDEANAYLKNLGWAAKLSQGDEWIVQLFPLPERQFPSLNLTLLMWSFSALTLTLAGAYWMEGSRPQSGWFYNSTLLDAVLGYTLPVLGSLFIASHIQKRIALHFNHRVGHITPIPEPTISLWSLGLLSQASLVWPFGLFLIPTLPRMDARLWDDRKVLGWVAVSVPATLVTLGMLLWGIGLWLTPEYVAITSAQNVAHGPFIVEILGQWQLNDYLTRLTWSHPFVKAGALLTFFSWISLLPIPTFPGGRIMVARAGSSEARSSSNQIFIFFLILAFAWMFEAFIGFTIWILVLTLILPLLLFMGTNRSSPLILNEPKGLDLKAMRNIGIVMLVAVLFALPSQVPFEVDEDWNASIIFGLKTDSTAIEIDEQWNALISVDVWNPSSINRDWSLDFDQYDSSTANWAMVWDCAGEDTLDINGFGCGSTLPPRTERTVLLNMTWTDALHAPSALNFSLLSLTQGEYQSHPISIQPDLDIHPASPWQMVYDEGEMKRCMTLNVDSTEPLNVSFPDAGQILNLQSRLQRIEGHNNLSASFDESPERICLQGLDPVVLRTSELNTIKLNDVLFDGGLPEFPMVAVVPSDGWTITNDALLGWGFRLDSSGLLSSIDALCPLDPTLSIPPAPSEGEWIWDVDVRKISNIPSVTDENQSLKIQMPDGASMHVCAPHLSVEPHFNFTVEEGPELVFQRYNSSHRIWSNMWMAAYNGSLIQSDGATFSIYSSGNSSIPVQINNQGNGDAWTSVTSVNMLSTGWNSFEFSPSNSTISTLWFEHQDEALVIHLSSYV
jgi:hypothetical protein